MKMKIAKKVGMWLSLYAGTYAVVVGFLRFGMPVVIHQLFPGATVITK